MISVDYVTQLLSVELQRQITRDTRSRLVYSRWLRSWSRASVLPATGDALARRIADGVADIIIIIIEDNNRFVLWFFPADPWIFYKAYPFFVLYPVTQPQLPRE